MVLLSRVFLVSLLLGWSVIANAAANKIVFEVEAKYEMNDVDSRLEARQILLREVARKAAEKVQDYIEKGMFFADDTKIADENLSQVAMMAYYTADVKTLSEDFDVTSRGYQVLTTRAEVTVDSGLVARRMALIGSNGTLAATVSTVEEDNARIDSELEEVTVELATSVSNERLMELVAKRKTLLMNFRANRDALVAAINRASIEFEAEEEMQELALFKYKTRVGYLNKMQSAEPYIQRVNKQRAANGGGNVDYYATIRFKVSAGEYVRELAKEFEVATYTLHELAGNIKTSVFPDRSGSLVKQAKYKALSGNDVFVVLDLGDEQRKVQIAGLSPRSEIHKFMEREKIKDGEEDFYVYNMILGGTHSSHAEYDVVFKGVPAHLKKEDLKLSIEVVNHGD